MQEVKVSDNFFSKEDHQYILNYCEDASYTYGECDNEMNIPTGMVHNIDLSEKVYQIISKRIVKSIPEIAQLKLYRMYVNCFAPGENPYFHNDGDRGLTFLYYPQIDWKLNDGGETQFYIDGDLYGIVPKPNRMVLFDAKIVHRATSFRDRHRFTVAIKYE